jgi:hypothetical protein
MPGKLIRIVGIVAIFVVALGARAQVSVGYGVATQGATSDSAATSYVFLQGFGAGGAGLTLSSWSFSTATFVGARDITPLLWESTGGTNFVLRAIGGTVNATGDTVYSGVAFNLQSGSSLIGNANYYFGWKDGTTTSPNTGVISWDDLVSSTQTAYSWGNSVGDNNAGNITSANLGSTFVMGNVGLGERTYRFTATAIPEPAHVAMAFALCCLAAAVRMRARDRKSAPPIMPLA